MRSIILRALVAMSWALAAFVSPVPASAEPVAFRNADGVWEWAESGKGTLFVPKSGDDTWTIAGTFNVTYIDVRDDTEVGFDSPVSGVARRETLHRVLRYLASVLDVEGTADLLVLASQTDGDGALASAGPFLLPRLGFQGGLVFEHLTTGSDPSDESLDGTVAVDFGFAWNSDGDATSDIEYDLYTALLHEVTHALGFFSAVGADARSELLNVDDTGLFSFADAFLVRDSLERPLFLDGGEINAIADDVSSRDLVFEGPLAAASFGAAPPIFAPRVFIDGSSIGHWDPAVGPDAVMLPILRRGDQRRALTPWELQMLADLGYVLAACVDALEGPVDCVPPAPDVLPECEDCNGPPLEQEARPPRVGLDEPEPTEVPSDEPSPEHEDPTGFASTSSGGGCRVTGRHAGAGWLGLGIAVFALFRRRARDRLSKTDRAALTDDRASS